MELNEHAHNKPRKNRLPEIAKIAIAGLVVAAICGLSFWTGVTYQKKRQNTIAATAESNRTMPSPNSGFGNGYGSRGNGLRGNMGTVTAVSATAISVNNNRTNSLSSYNISSETVVTNNGKEATVSDIAVGDIVAIQTASTDSKLAAKIMLNPTMPSAPGTDSNAGDYDNSAL